MSDSYSDTDVKLIVGNGSKTKEFSAHSTVLRSRSLYFQRALSERWKDQKHGLFIITKPNIQPDIFESILNYIYTGKNICQTSGENSLNILVASDELELLDLAECAQKHLINKFSPWLFSNIVKSFNIICRYSHFNELYDYVQNFIFRNPYSIFDSVDLHLLDELALKCLLESDDLELEEIEIWNCLIKWGISKLMDENITNWSDENINEWSDDHFNALKETISHCIPLIRYYYIPKYYIDKQIKCYQLDSNTFVKSKTPPRRFHEINVHSVANNYGLIGFFSTMIFNFIFSTTQCFILNTKPYFSKTSNSFIFSFTDQSNPVLSRVKIAKKDKAIWNNELCGPCFGKSDLRMGFSNYWSSQSEDYEYKITNSNIFIAKEYER
ncbi:13164_t:CDS:2 [Cetraspora pellucida]|uniref:13164_t:CDS:1 n=1 Tax=Cetraspora pellucida TaxID=1433469 RepID=A0A9N8WRJ0_9GLOM|nr:13164_t:CDS:2 [Cetraspora pellucida]